MRVVASLFMAVICLAGCNSVYLTPNSLSRDDVVYIDRGGHQMQHVIKQHMESRGYTITVGHKRSTIKSTYIVSGEDTSVLADADDGRARYIIEIDENEPDFKPVWCALNGFWWWRFYLSISDNVTGKEILSWTGRGCENSTLRKLDRILDQMEIKDEQ